MVEVGCPSCGTEHQLEKKEENDLNVIGECCEWFFVQISIRDEERIIDQEPKKQNLSNCKFYIIYSGERNEILAVNQKDYNEKINREN
ncbi:MAG: hypothetical protein BTN85_1141 [Candidatus Methanohalarchaeum thermophilum]|uniref:Uncharacterized protein n=1 Tax=Methanohalarchaeum thermophilum TaxID=1903181 RepID=A0A1Q6DWA4_METT1|nr:MAG: hypothetical protein BTN85_1141 [Candidatus Methanohalarchaeum thermophilum]